MLLSEACGRWPPLKFHRLRVGILVYYGNISYLALRTSTQEHDAARRCAAKAGPVASHKWSTASHKWSTTDAPGSPALSMPSAIEVLVAPVRSEREAPGARTRGLALVGMAVAWSATRGALGGALGGALFLSTAVSGPASKCAHRL